MPPRPASPSLKIRHNNVLGYHIEVDAAARAEARRPASSIARRSPPRCATRRSSWASSKAKIASAADKALALELQLFDELVGDALGASTRRSRAPARRWPRSTSPRRWPSSRRPSATAGPWSTTAPASPSPAAAIRWSRRRCKRARRQASSPTTATLAAGQRLWLLTGPNMAGKSTFLRQNALIARAGADGLLRAGRARRGSASSIASSAASAPPTIWRAAARPSWSRWSRPRRSSISATPRSLVILDEIGRGTATFDGLSIAWAAVEHLHDVNRCRALFATHYHELTALAAKLPDLACYTMRVKEWQGDVVFLHEVAPGAADRSYGIHVAKLAGLPPPVVARAEEVLETLESGEQGGALTRLAEDLPLFAAARAARAAAAIAARDGARRRRARRAQPARGARAALPPEASRRRRKVRVSSGKNIPGRTKWLHSCCGAARSRLEWRRCWRCRLTPRRNTPRVSATPRSSSARPCLFRGRSRPMARSAAPRWPISTRSTTRAGSTGASSRSSSSTTATARPRRSSRRASWSRRTTSPSSSARSARPPTSPSANT